MPVFLLLLYTGCAADRALMEVPVSLLASGSQVETDEGVAITLDTASATISDLRFEAPAATAWRWSGWSPIRAARAHPGHDFAGDVAGELVGTWTVDLLGDDLELGNAACYEGTYASARLTLLPDPTVLLEGVAQVEDLDPVPFRLELAPDQEITGIPFEVELDAAAPPAGITLSTDLAHALSFVDWTTADDDDDGVLTVADGPLANTTLFGVVSTPTWNLSLED